MTLRIPALIALAIAAFGAPAAAQDTAAVRDVAYHLTFDRETAARRTVHVEMSFEVTGPGHVLLSLPVWTPGAYDVTNFARWVTGFDARRDTATLDWDKADPDTWRVTNPGPGPVTVSFDVLADSLDTAMSWARSEFLLFNGTNLFPWPEGADLEEYAATVTIRTEPDWLVATGMTPADSVNTWRAESYHDLVDMPTFVGRFDFDSMQVGEVWMRLATYPSGSVAGETRTQTWTALQRMFPPMAAVFEEVPFRTYTVLQLADSTFGGASGLEHQNSHVDVITPLAIGNPLLSGLYAHEIFHAWNVKRLRPAELVPYRYDAWQPTTLLWVSEGVTDYYADLAQLRGGLITPDQFYAVTTQKMQQVANVPPVALEDASLSTWAPPPDGTGFIYYPKGSLAGFLLDIMIRDASDNRSSLDLVMRELYRRTYEQGRGFTDEEWWSAVARAAPGRDMVAFRLAYVDGREPFPYDRVLPLAGLRIQTDTLRQARIGVSTEQDTAGVRVVEVVPNSMAAAAGVMPGDLLRRVGDIEVEDAAFGAEYRRLYSNQAGEEIELVVRRGGEDVTLTGRIEVVPVANPRLVAEPGAGARALRVRQGLLTGTITR
ncbi:MAG: PDZ domain-containing protein [Gemmatimonadota bacterium]|nr:PDZ domain-containing protein [Gemmatimonadota bacterium]